MTRVRILFGFGIASVLAISLGAGVYYAEVGASRPAVVSSCDSSVDFNGTKYCSFDITGSTAFNIPGYAIMQTPIRFIGVQFQTVCPDDQGNCGNRTVPIYTPFILLNVIFPDGKNETVGTPLEIHTTLYFLSTHFHPRAGFYVEYVPGASVVNLKLFLLVEAGQ